MHIDTWTVLVMLPAILSATSLGYFFFWLQERSQCALLWMVGNTALVALGYILRLTLPLAAAIRYGDSLILLGIGCQWMACRAVGQRPARRWMLLTPACLWLAATFLPGFMPHLHLRLMAFNLLSSSTVALSFLELRRTRAEARFANLWVSGLLAALAISQFAWVLRNLPFWSHDSDSAAFTASPGLGYLMFSTAGFTMLLSFGMIALVRAPAERHFRQAAMVDALTGLGNRRRLDEYLEGALRRARRAGTGLAVVMIDVDHFKRYNDHYGHPAGDACLRAIAAALIGPLVRDEDEVMRYGGEEFLVVLPQTSAQAALAIAERLRLAVRGLGLPHVGGQDGLVTISAGVAAIRAEHLHAHSLLYEADQALYRAKQRGRDQVAAAPRSENQPEKDLS